MSCPSRDELLEHFAGTTPEEKIPELEAHLLGCDQCRNVQSALETTTSRIASDPDEFDDPNLPHDVLELIRLGQTAPAGRGSRFRWPVVAAPLVAIAASIILFVAIQPDPKPDGFTPRSGHGREADRWVRVDIFRTRPGTTGYQRVRGTVRPEDALLFAVTNKPPSPFEHLMILAVDDSGEIYWYYPAYQSESESPSSIHVPQKGEPQELKDAVRHDLRSGGWLRVYGVFSKEALHVPAVERLIRSDLAHAGGIHALDRLDLPETGQHTFLLKVE